MLGLLDIVRFRRLEHHEAVNAWQRAAGEPELPNTLLPEDSTFILTADGVPWICVTVFLTNSVDLAWVDNLVANPELPAGAARDAAVQMLQKFLEVWAADLGYRRLFCLTRHKKLGKRYERLGYEPSGESFQSFVKLLKGK